MGTFHFEVRTIIWKGVRGLDTKQAVREAGELTGTVGELTRLDDDLLS
jgi:hypothetical protein